MGTNYRERSADPFITCHLAYISDTAPFGSMLPIRAKKPKPRKVKPSARSDGLVSDMLQSHEIFHPMHTIKSSPPPSGLRVLVVSGCGITGTRKTHRQHNATPAATGSVLVAAVFAAKHVDSVHGHGPLLHKLEEPAPSAPWSWKLQDEMSGMCPHPPSLGVCRTRILVGGMRQ